MCRRRWRCPSARVSMSRWRAAMHSSCGDTGTERRHTSDRGSADQGARTRAEAARKQAAELARDAGDLLAGGHFTVHGRQGCHEVAAEIPERLHVAGVADATRDLGKMAGSHVAQ